MAIPVQIIELRAGTALVASDARQFEVGRLFLPDAMPGDWALAHSGQLISRLSPEELEPLLELMRELRALQPELENWEDV
jgi:hydrogenase maturation factor